MSYDGTNRGSDMFMLQTRTLALISSLSVSLFRVSYTSG